MNWKKIVKIFMLLVLGCLLILHFRITYHSGYLLKKFISSQSKGTLIFDSDLASVNYINGRIEFTNISLYSLAKNHEKNTYNISCKKVVLQLTDVFPLVTGKNLSIDSIIIESPDVHFIKNEKRATKQINLAAEWAAIYNAIIKTVEVFYVNKLNIKEGSFSVHYADDPAGKPFKISGVNLLVHQLYVTKKNTDSAPISIKEIALTFGREKISIPGENSDIGFKRFSINTSTGLVMLDSCFVNSRSVRDSSEINIFTETLCIQHLDFERLYLTGNIKAGKILLARPQVQLSLNSNMGGKVTRKKSLSELIAGFTTSLSVDELVVQDAKSSITIAGVGKARHITVNDVNFYINRLAIDGSIACGVPLRYDSIDLSIKKYSGTNTDNSLRFETGFFHIVNGEVEIEQLSLYPGNRRHYSLKYFSAKKIKLDDFSIYDLIFYNVFSAHAITLFEPNIDLIKLHGNSSRASGHTAGTAFNKFFKVENLFIINGQINYAGNDGKSAEIRQINGSANLSGIITTTSTRDLVTRMQRFGFGYATLRIPAGIILLQHGRLTPETGILRIKKVLLNFINPSIKANLDKVQTTVDLFENMDKEMKIKYLGWGGGLIRISMDEKRSIKKTISKQVNIIAEKINFENTALAYSNGDQSIQSFLKDGTIGDLKIVNGDKPNFKNIHLLAQRTNIHDSLLDLSVRSINIPAIDQVVLSGVQFQKTGTNGNAHVTVSSLRLKTNINKLVGGYFDFDSVLINDASFSLKLKGEYDNKKINHTLKLPPFIIKNLGINNANGFIKLADPRQLSFDLKDLSMLAKGIAVDSASVSVNNNELTTGGIIFTKNAMHLFTGSVYASGNNFYFKDSIWNYFSDKISAGNAQITLVNKDSVKTVLRVDRLTLDKLMFNTDNFNNIKTMLKDNSSGGIDITNLNIEGPDTHIKIGAVTVPEINKDIRLDSITIASVLSREDFIQQCPWQTDDVRVFVRKLNLKGWRNDAFVKEGIISFTNIDITDPLIDVYRDKNKLHRHGIIKPLPTRALQNVPFHFSLDTISFNNAHVLYQEKSAGTKLTGKVEFTSIHAKGTNVKNTGLTDTDSLSVIASARFMDKALVKIRIEESYKDSLSGFLLSVHLSPTPLDILNDITQASASVQIRSGYADTMYMYAVAREYISLGKMYLPYSNLKVRFLKKGVEADKYFLGSLITFAANTFIIKRNNRSRQGVIYFPRLREEGIFNYLAKMFLSGAASSAGAKSNRSYLRKYKRALKEKELPPIRPVAE